MYVICTVKKGMFSSEVITFKAILSEVDISLDPLILFYKQVLLYI
jgi:hypothetical protein